MKLTCLNCHASRAAGQYLCRNCWHKIPGTTRQNLNRRDAKAMHRLRELHNQLTAGVPLSDITVTP